MKDDKKKTSDKEAKDLKSEKGKNKFIDTEPTLEEELEDDLDDEFDDLSDEEINEEISHMINELFELTFSGGGLSEALDRVQRRKMGLRMKRMKRRLAIAKKKAMRRAPTRERVAKRARREAISTVKKKVSSGKVYSDMSVGQKQLVDRKMKKKVAAVERITRKLMPKKRKGG